ncbi:hypothetical protein STEG23_019201 [Scotinomys teguina]
MVTSPCSACPLCSVYLHTQHFFQSPELLGRLNPVTATACDVTPALCLSGPPVLNSLKKQSQHLYPLEFQFIVTENKACEELGRCVPHRGQYPAVCGPLQNYLQKPATVGKP